MSHASCLVAVDCLESEIKSAVTHQMKPFDENGWWFRKGSRWDWWVIGGRYSARLMGRNWIKRGDVDLDAMLKTRQESYRKSYAEASKKDRVVRSLCYGIEDNMSEDQYVATAFPITAFAFLRSRRWNEHERLGWFGGTAKTECKIAGKETHRCLCRDKKTGSAIISWGGDVRWDQKFYDRFVRDLEPETWLVMVDYHV